MAKPELKQEYVKHLFDYRDDGCLVRRKSYGRWKKGAVTGHVGRNGYTYVYVGKKLHLVHRIIYLLNHGCNPQCVDHIDRNKLNNRIKNLRACTFTQNQFNRISNKDTKSRHKGVTFSKASGKWYSKGNINGKTKHHGSFDTEDEAAVAYNNAMREYHGEFFIANEVGENNV